MGSYNTREIALTILKEVNHDGKYSNIALKNELKKYSLSKQDTAFITQLVYGTLEKQITIDWILDSFTKIKKKNPWLINILRMGCYQILYLDRVPNSAACNEAVKLTKKYVSKSLSGYVNGVLRNIARNIDNIKTPSIAKDPITYFMLKYSCPRWLCNMWLKQYGLDYMEFILDSSALKDITTLRANTTKIDTDKLIQNLYKLGLSEIEKGIYMNDALRVKHIGNIEANPLYIKGYYTVQSESSMLCVNAMDVSSGERVLDACSAPGGKACYMAQNMQNIGVVDAWDIHPHRVSLIEQNAKRLGVSIVKAQQRDATIYLDNYRNLYDKVLLICPVPVWE
ncbi:MAG TPA: 16S rRNA (cytosine(967)-C(5))-methyltransferase RsmB [Clostridiales bacterium]|nr:16S rRNA (cytosine(967)-C(5))-methyltransferase RsmB [Clostridiales bacterium]